MKIAKRPPPRGSSSFEIYLKCDQLFNCLSAGSQGDLFQA